MSHALKAGLSYFVVVFGAGCLLGPVRVLWVVPQLGERTAELLEMPIMALVTIAAARWVVGRMTAPTTPRLLATGLTAFGLLVAAEVPMVVFVRHMTIAKYIASRDPVSGMAFVFMLVLVAVMPLVVGTLSRPRSVSVERKD